MHTADGHIQVRQVTDVHANWSEQGDGTPGKFRSSSSWTTARRNTW